MRSSRTLRLARSGNRIQDAARAAVVGSARPMVIAEPLEERRLMSAVSVFDNGTYVDTSGGFGAESDNVQKVLQSQGHTVKPFTGITSLNFRQAMGKAETLLIPELENANLSSALTSAAKSALSSYVGSGGGLILCADSDGNYTSLLNSVFGFSFGSTSSSSPSNRTSNASGTAFSSAPPALDDNNATYALTGLGGDSKAIYTNGSGNSTVTLISYGSGKIVVLGYDFYDSDPIGSQDGGWLSVMNKAVAATKVTDTDPDDEMDEALAAAVGGTYGNAISIPNGSDVDMYKFSATAGQVLTFSMTKATGSNVDAFLRLFNANGDQVGGDDQSGGSNNALFTKTISTTGSYWIACSGWSNTSFDPVTGFGDSIGTTGAYQLKITGPTANTDPNDQISEAASVALGSNITTTIGDGLSGGQPLGQDVDMYKFTVSAGQKIGFDVDKNAGSGLNSLIRLFSYNAGTNTAAELAKNDNGAAPGEVAGTDSYLEYTFASAGTYYLGLSASVNTAYGPISGTSDVTGTTGAAKVFFNVIPVPGDINDQISEAVLKAVPSTTAGAIASATDVNMYKITVVAGKTVKIDIDRPAGSLLDSYLRLFTAAGVQLATNDNGIAPGEAATGKDPYLSFTFSAAGTYYIGVSSKGNAGYNPTTGLGDAGGSSTGSYNLILS